ncbi:hypothetical protein BD410DRAFT_716936 [Rickenella mellea]|uniref:Chromosome transmission fidelity protein 8 n=1 Tax=Rickenella mellea TaxID=50990 RepID=A0A4Y7QDJ9_9AGAM|nr:hypothetical protein BD410DRAFT_716936 [Rickenella mellea]
MIIPINFASSSNSDARLPPQLARIGTDEVVLIELQGALQVEGDRAGQQVGKLHFANDDEKPTLTIGHHLLEGKVVKLPKPLAVLYKRQASTPGALDDPSREDSGSDVGYDVVGVVKRKLIFSKRPIPIVSTPSVSSAVNGGESGGNASGNAKASLKWQR